MITHNFSKHTMYARAFLKHDSGRVDHWDFKGEIQRRWWVEHGCLLYCQGDHQSDWRVQWPNERDMLVFTLKYS